MRLIFLFGIFLLSFFSHSQTQCDSATFKIKGSEAKAIALKQEYQWYMRFHKMEVRSVNDSCRWFVETASMATNHHGYYSTTYHEYEIDAFTGQIVKRGGHKKLGGKVPDYDLDSKRSEEKKKRK